QPDMVMLDEPMAGVNPALIPNRPTAKKKKKKKSRPTAGKTEEKPAGSQHDPAGRQGQDVTART
ncbi:hypothetical protein, partial [Actinoplanes sp. NPDC026670]|uniref:hypothetical protein n=1 Tax=Actinoplanes sp. NPDC026670 TaxID=3154700 RepID=UPI0033CB6363